MTPQDILLKVLTIIGYEDDKNKFAEDFIGLCLKQAVANSIEALPEDKRKTFEQEVKDKKDAKEIAETLQKYVAPAEYEKKLSDTTATLFQDYIENILPTLDEETRNTLLDYLASLSNNQQPQTS